MWDSAKKISSHKTYQENDVNTPSTTLGQLGTNITGALSWGLTCVILLQVCPGVLQVWYLTMLQVWYLGMLEVWYLEMLEVWYLGMLQE